jgi:galactokinase
MLDIGQLHRIEYELTEDSSTSEAPRGSIHVAIAEAPGRIHFMGEPMPGFKSGNSSENEDESGIFLSAAVDRYINVAVSQRKDNSFRFFAADLKERKRSTLVNLKFRREDRWANYLKPAIYLFTELGYHVRGLNFSFCGDIPQHIGLASSIAIETAAATALKNLLHVQIDDIEFAKKIKDAHFSIFGAHAPLEDYLVCVMAKKDHFMIVNSVESEVKLIKSPFSGFKFLLIDSRVPRMGAEGEIASRRYDISLGLKLLSKKKEGASFKDFASSDLLEVLGNFPEQIRRRSMHIVDEIRRLSDAEDALERSDLASFAKIIYHSHESLRDLYEISCPEIDWLVKRAQEIEGAAGSRMTGLGFGGCTYTIIRKELVEEYKRRLEEYERIFGFRPVIYEVKLVAKTRMLPARKRVYA